MRLTQRLGPAGTEQAVSWLDRAAKAGIAPAQLALGGIYEKGLGVGKDTQLARVYYLAAAQRGNAKAMHNLAVLYAQGAGGNPDYATAAKWFRKAAMHGLPDSQFNLAVLYDRGAGNRAQPGRGLQMVCDGCAPRQRLGREEARRACATARCGPTRQCQRWD